MQTQFLKLKILDKINSRLDNEEEKMDLMEVLVRGSERGRKGWDEEKIQQISKTSSVT